MYLLGEQPAYADQLINRLQSIPTQLLDGLEPEGLAVTFERVDDLAELLPGNRFSCCIRSLPVMKQPMLLRLLKQIIFSFYAFYWLQRYCMNGKRKTGLKITFVKKYFQLPILHKLTGTKYLH